MSSELYVSGAASGIDWRGIVEKLIEIDRRSISFLEGRKSELSELKSVWSEVKTRLVRLEGKLLNLKLQSTFTSMTAVSSDEKSLTAVAGAGAGAGIYSVTVSKLAQAHTVASDRRDDPLAGLGFSGSFSINGKTVTVSAEDSLIAVANKVNATQDIGVSASVVDNRLVIQGLKTGASNAIAFSDPDYVLRNLGVLNSDETVKYELASPQDAEFQVNGLTITRSTNDPDDVISGVTLHLKSVTSVPVRLEVKADSHKAVSSIKEFVDAFNGALDYLNSQLSKGGRLFGDPTAQRLASSLRLCATGVPAGISSGFRCLADIGVETSSDKSGRLTVNEDELSGAVESDSEAVWRLFADPSEGVAGIAESLESLTSMWTRFGDGIIPNRLESFDARTKALDDQISREELRLELRERSMVQRFIAMENALSSIQSQSVWLQSQFQRLGAAIR